MKTQNSQNGAEVTNSNHKNQNNRHFEKGKKKKKEQLPTPGSVSMMTFSRFLTPELHNPINPLAPSPSTIWYEFDISSTNNTQEKLKFNNGEKNQDWENYKQKSKRKTINTWVYILKYKIILSTQF